MLTTKARINITLPEKDSFWHKIAEQRDKKGAKFVSHANVWKRCGYCKLDIKGIKVEEN